MFITRVATRRWPGAELIEVPLPACMTDQKEVEVYLEEHCPGWFMARLAQIARLAMLDPPEHGFYA